MFKWLRNIFRQEDKQQVQHVIGRNAIGIQTSGDLVVEKTPNATTRQAMEDSEAGRVARFASVDAMVKDIETSTVNMQAKGRVTRTPAKAHTTAVPVAPTRKVTETSRRRDDDDAYIYTPSVIDTVVRSSSYDSSSSYSSSSSCSSSYDSGSSSSSDSGSCSGGGD